ncbi:MAG TPA: Vms1/Ankzf1 family peptidyl-tRNA hydrolase [Dehalococcoidales bacterium]
MLSAKQFKLTKTKMLAYLDELERAGEIATTLYLPPGISQTEVDSYLRQIPAIAPVSAEVSKNIVTSQTGAVIFWGQTNRRLIVPPFPIKDKYVTTGYDIAPLRTLLMHDYRIGIVLVRLGSYAIGICEGETLILHKAGTGLIHSRHRQGGSSAARFQRRREDQTHHFLERVGGHIREIFEPYTKKLDYFVYGGAWTTIQQLQKQCDFLRQFDDRLLPPLLEIPDPRFTVLEKAVPQIWPSRVLEWRDN